MTKTENTAPTDATDAELAALAASLEDLPDTEEEIVEDEALELSDDDLEINEDVLADDDVEDLELAIDKSTSYAAQTGDDVETVNPKRDGSSAAKKTGGKSSGPTKPRMERDLSKIEGSFFMLTGDPKGIDQNVVKKAKDDLIAATPKQVKIAEKFENTIIARANGKKPSKYVMIAFAALEASKADPKTITMSDIIAAYTASGLGDGTARSQAGQMMVLFDVLGIAKRNGKELTAQPDSNFATFLRGVV